MSGIITLSDARNTTPNKKPMRHKKSCTVAIETRKHGVHNIRSSLVTGIKDIVTTCSQSSCTQKRSDSITYSDRSPDDINRLSTGCHLDLIQEMIDSIVANRLVWNQRLGSFREGPGRDASSKIASNRLPDSTMMKVTSQADLADGHTIPFTSPASDTIDIAFNEDTRWHGVHPFHIKVKNMARFEALIPHGYRYARDLQVEAAFIPPLHHPRGSPGKDFVLQKRGTSAIPIVDPKTVTKIRSTCTSTRTILALRNEVRHGQDLTPAAHDAFSVRPLDETVTQVDLILPTLDPHLQNMIKDPVTITEIEVSVRETDNPSGSNIQLTHNQSIEHHSTCSVHSQIEANSVGGCVTPSRASLVSTIRKRTRRRQA